MPSKTRCQHKKHRRKTRKTQGSRARRGGTYPTKSAWLHSQALEIVKNNQKDPCTYKDHYEKEEYESEYTKQLIYNQIMKRVLKIAPPSDDQDDLTKNEVLSVIMKKFVSTEMFKTIMMSLETDQLCEIKSFIEDANKDSIEDAMLGR